MSSLILIYFLYQCPQFLIKTKTRNIIKAYDLYNSIMIYEQPRFIIHMGIILIANNDNHL